MAEQVKFKVKIEADANSVDAANESVVNLNVSLKDTEQSSGKAASSFSEWERSVVVMNSLSDMMGKFNTQIQKAAGTFNEFDKAMRAANTMAGLSEDEFQRMKDSISDISKEVPKTRTELAEGLYAVISNGVTEPAEALKFLEMSARASVGGIADLSQVIGVTQTVLKNYGLEASAAADIQDKIQMTAKNGVTSFEQLAAALPSVSGNAATLGVNIDELMATFATLTGVSGNTAAVSTQLGAVFTALVKPSVEAATMAEQMGIKFDAAAIKAAGGFEPFLKSLDASVKAYSAATGTLEQEVYGKLFGSAEALKALIPLQGELSSKYSENVAMMADANGTIDESFAQMSQTGEATSLMFSNAVQSMTDWIGSVAAAIAPSLDMVVAAGDVATSMNGIGQTAKAAFTALKDMQAGTKLAAAGQWLWNAALEANPIVIVTAAAAALAAIIYELYQNNEETRIAVDQLWDSVKELADILVGSVMSAFSGTGETLKEVGLLIKEYIFPILGKLVSFFIKLADIIVRNVINSIRNLANTLKKVWNYIADLLGLDKTSVEITVEETIETRTEDGEKIENPVAAAPPKKAAAQQKKQKAAKAEYAAGSIGYMEQQLSELKAKFKAEVDPDSRAAIQKQINDIDARIKLEVEMASGGGIGKQDNFGIDTTVADAAEELNARLKKQSEEVATSVNMQAEAFDILKQRHEAVADCIGGLGQSFGKLGVAIGGSAGAMLGWAADTMSAIAAVLPQISTLILANEASSIAGATSSGASVPFPFNIIAIAAGVAAVVASFAKMPKFADGGIAYGPTLGLFGEYAGASNNPEVVAPLDRLRTLIGDAGGMNGNVSFEIKGRRLVGVLSKEKNIKARQ